MWCEMAACESPTASLDVAGAEPALLPRDELAARLPARTQQIQDLQPRRIPERLEDGDQIGPFHRSITIDVLSRLVKCQGLRRGIARTA